MEPPHFDLPVKKHYNMRTMSNPKSKIQSPKSATTRVPGARTFLSAFWPSGGCRAGKNARSSWLAAGLLLLATPALAPAQTGIPAAINYQGTLTDNLGNPVTNGYYQVQFRIWDSAMLTGAGDYIWGRSYPLYVAVGGLFNILLNDDGGLVTSPATPQVTNLLSAFAGPSRYLGLTIIANPQGAIATPVEISPRQQLVSAPYAMQAQNATAAVSAGFATNALQAITAASTGFATNALNATNALRATTSASADIATTALNLGSAGVAQEVGIYGTVRAFQSLPSLPNRSIGTLYTAETDGFVIFSAYHGTAHFTLQDANGNQLFHDNYFFKLDQADTMQASWPVAKGEKYQWDFEGANGSAYSKMYWRPLGR